MAIKFTIRETYELAREQVTIQEVTGLQEAIFRLEANASETLYAAVLDRRNAHGSVPENKLVELVHSRLQEDIGSVFEETPQPMTVRTKGDDTDTLSSITKRGHRAHRYARNY